MMAEVTARWLVTKPSASSSSVRAGRLLAAEVLQAAALGGPVGLDDLLGREGGAADGL